MVKVEAPQKNRILKFDPARGKMTISFASRKKEEEQKNEKEK